MQTPLDKAHQRLYAAINAYKRAEAEFNQFMKANPQGSAPGLLVQMAEYKREQEAANREIDHLLKDGHRG